MSTNRRRALHLSAVFLALAVLIPKAQTTRADPGFCELTPTGPTCPTYPPPDLLNLNQSLYAATPDQAASLERLEDQAITNTIADHGLATTDRDAVKSWGRADAEAELFSLIVQAIKTTTTSRTTDQQNAVDWVAAVEQRQAVTAAQDAAFEYVKWAGLNQDSYWSLLAKNPSQSDLTTFLSGPVVTYDIPRYDGGYCLYRSPAPYGSDYTGYNDQTCFTPCTSFLGCTPPTPSYDQFVKWGDADANNSLMSSAQYVQAAGTLATGLAFGGAVVGAGLTGVAVSSALSGVLVGSALQEAIWPFLGSTIEEIVEEGVMTATEAAEFAGELTASAVGAVVSVVIVALTIAIMGGITVANAAALPGKLASLVTSARTTPLDPASLLSDSNGGSSLYSLFVGATLPVPVNQTCDNSGATVPPGLTILPGSSPIIIEPLVPCLNPTPIPSPSSTDPQFVVQAKDATTQTVSPTITLKDTSLGSTTTARLSGNWFITQYSGVPLPAQTLRIWYTDWNGTEQNAWLVGNATDGYDFVGFAVSTGASTPVDPSTCKANNVCWSSSSIDYLDSGGNKYSASVRGYAPSTGSPSYSTPIEGSPVTFKAGGFAPGSATGSVTYTWQFQQAGCGIPCVNVDTKTMTSGPAYTDPVSGDTATYTWQTSGSYLVSLTAADAAGAQVNDTFTISVGDAPPKVTVSPACPLATPCDARIGSVGTSMVVTGTIIHTGTLDNETATVNWGDGSNGDNAGAGPNTLPSGGNPLTLTASSDNSSFAFSDAHTYSNPGIYFGTVQVYDWGGGSDSQGFKETVQGTQTITFQAIPPHTYGDPPFAISATGGASRNRVTFASTDPTVCTVSSATSGVDASGNGTGSAKVTLLKAATCTITADQAGATLYEAASRVSQAFMVQKASVTVTASSATILPGHVIPGITPSYSGFVAGDSPSSLTTLPTCGTTAPPSSSPGFYTTNCSGAVAPNYQFVYLPGTLAIEQVASGVGNLTCSPDAILTGIVGQDLIVDGTVCRVGHVHVVRDVIVKNGGSLIGDVVTGRNLQAQGAAQISLTGGDVGQDAILQATSSGPDTFNGVWVGRDLTIQSSGAHAAWQIRNAIVGGSAMILSNLGSIDVEANRVTRTIQVQGNSGGVTVLQNHYQTLVCTADVPAATGQCAG
jgi:hypothetical protein